MLNIFRKKRKEILEEVKGNKNAVFLGEGTTEEYEDMEKERKGLKKLYDKIKNL